MSEEPDVERLREDIDQIKEAMGLAERYEGVTAQWLLFGVLVAVAAAISRYVMLGSPRLLARHRLDRAALWRWLRRHVVAHSR